MIPKHAIHMRPLKINGCRLEPINSISKVPDNNATEMARKRTPNALLTNTVSVSLFNHYRLIDLVILVLQDDKFKFT